RHCLAAGVRQLVSNLLVGRPRGDESPSQEVKEPRSVNRSHYSYGLRGSDVEPWSCWVTVHGLRATSVQAYITHQTFGEDDILRPAGSPTWRGFLLAGVRAALL